MKMTVCGLVVTSKLGEVENIYAAERICKNSESDNDTKEST